MSQLSEDLVLELERERLKGMHDLNIEKLDQLLHERFVFTHNNGMNESKSEFLGRLGAGNTHYALPELEDVAIRNFGECMIINGRLKSEVTIKGQDKSFRLDNRFISVWVLGGGYWQAASYQSTPLQS